MEFYMNIIWPQEDILQCVILFLILLGGYVIYLCGKLKVKINSNMKTIDALGTKDAVTYLENTLKMNNVDHNAWFEAFESNNDKNSKNEPVFEHLRAIYDAGRKSSRFDADLMVKNTIDNICISVDSIKTCISLFLVIGILGTLLGLGLSIGSFSGESFIVNAQSNNTAQELSKLFGNLRGAFAPSMWGVFMTIIFVISYTVFIQEASINRLSDKLTVNTVKVWLPALYPTDFQKGENTMVQLKETIQNAEQINYSANTLVSNLNMANSTVKAMNDMSTALTNSLEQFEKGSKEIGTLEESISALTKHIEESNKNSMELLGNAISKINSLQSQGHEMLLEQADSLNKSFTKQNEQFAEMVKTLKIYDDNSFKLQEKINLGLTDAIKKQNLASEDVKNAVVELDKRDEKIVSTVGTPLTEQLTVMSEHLNDSLRDMTNEVKNLKSVMDKIDSPLTQTAGQLQKMLGNMQRDMLENMQELLAVKGGLTKEDIKLLRNNNSNNDETLKEILNCLQEAKNQDKTFSRNVDGLEKLSKIMPICIAVLLAVSIGVQVWMVNKIDYLQQSQSVVNQILLKGERN